MKRNKKLFAGPKVRYFEHSAGVVNTRKPLILTVFLPSVIVMALLGAGGVYGYNNYLKPVAVASAQEAPVEVPKPVEEADTSPVEQKAFQAKEDVGLSGTIKEKLDTMPKDTKWSVSVRDLNSGRMANINADNQMESASLYKLFLLAPLEKKISADNWKSKVGDKTINACVEAMIKVSDNDCPQALGNYINWKTIDTYNESLGFKNTKIGKKDQQVTSSRDVSELMYRLQNSQILSDKARRLVFDALYGQKYRTGIPTGCGSECLVGNKTGDLSKVKHDAAIVTHGSAKYVVVVMSEGGSWQQIGDIARAVDIAMLP